MNPATPLAGTLYKDRTSLKEVLNTKNLVAHTGFEPVISSLRGRCPRPLDECAKVRHLLSPFPPTGATFAN
jgi:hypothetical protein